MDEAEVMRVLRAGAPDADEAFREELLQRCLAVLDSGEGGGLLSEGVLDLLSAAGDLQVRRDLDLP